MSSMCYRNTEVSKLIHVWLTPGSGGQRKCDICTRFERNRERRQGKHILGRRKKYAQSLSWEEVWQIKGTQIVSWLEEYVSVCVCAHTRAHTCTSVHVCCYKKREIGNWIELMLKYRCEMLWNGLCA